MFSLGAQSLISTDHLQYKVGIGDKSILDRKLTAERVDMKMVGALLLIKMMFCLFFLGQFSVTSASRQHFSSGHQQLRKGSGVDKPYVATRWWSEDYSSPHRRRHVHNSFEP
ncbi:hypothetical protein LINGRAHAP2_LOCUS34261 [Linum grandiflorum]